MEQTVKGRSIVSIGVTIRKHLTTLKHFASSRNHWLQQCMEVYGYWKAEDLNCGEKKMLTTKREDTISEAIEFVGLCYNITKGKDMSPKRSIQLFHNSKCLFPFPGSKHDLRRRQESCLLHWRCPHCYQQMNLLLKTFWEPTASALSDYRHSILIPQL